MKYVKTESGQHAFKTRSPLLTGRQRAVFIFFDGHKTVEQVLAATSGLSITEDDVEYLLAQGFLSSDASVRALTEPMPLMGFPSAPAPLIEMLPKRLVVTRTPQERYADAKPLATALTASLGLRGFRLNLAVESAAGLPDLLAIFPKIQEAVGAKAAEPLERALKG